MSLFAELRRRNVVKIGITYLVVAWLLVQVVSVFAPALRLPEWVVTLVAFVLILGFPIALVLAWVYELTPEGFKRTAEVPKADSITRGTGQRLNYVMTGALALVLALVLIDTYVLRDEAAGPNAAAGPDAAAAGQSPQPAGPASASRARIVLPNSVAVLPFANMSPSENDAYFAAGVHEEVLNYLAKLSELNVIARTSMLRYADTPLSIRDIADELNVETVMEGSVRYAGDEVRITAQLIDPATGAHLWSEAYQRKIDDIFAIQADIAMNIANAVGARFSLAEQKAIETPPTSSAEAYALYLQAGGALYSALPGANQSAHLLLDRAIAIDPAFGRAHAFKAALYSAALINTTQGTAVAPEGRAALERQAREHAEIALALDPLEPLASASVALRVSDLLAWRWANYVETLRPAEERVFLPVNLWAVSWMGKHADALRIGEKNAELSPNDAEAHMVLGIVYAYAGDRAASTRSLDRSLELAPANPLARAWHAYNVVVGGDRDEALEQLRLVERMAGANPQLVFLPELAYAYSRIGRSDDALRFFEAIEARAAETDVGAGTWAMGYLAIGDEEEVLRQLEIAAEKARNHEPDQGYLQLMNLKMNFLADPRLEEPRFADVLDRIRGD